MVKNRTGSRTEPQITIQQSTGIGQDMQLEESRRTIKVQNEKQKQVMEAWEAMKRRNVMEIEEEQQERG